MRHYETTKTADPLVRQRRQIIYLGILCLVLVLVIMQLWLLMATMNAFLAGDFTVIWPAAVASAVCFALNVGLVVYLYRIEKETTHPPAYKTQATGLNFGEPPDPAQN